MREPQLRSDGSIESEPLVRDLVGHVLADRYRVERRLGAGAMGSVWQVQHVESLQRMALKALHGRLAAQPRALQRFLREARAAATLRSAHVVRLIDAQMGHVLDGQPMPFLVMELLEGATVERLVQERGRLSVPEICWMMRQIALGLRAAHQHGIVHRDLKPANVFVAIGEDNEPVVKLCDFGIAKLGGDSFPDLASASSGDTILGTPMYMAPEQLKGASHVTPETDQWALALLAFHALSGREYFSRVGSAAELVVAILTGPLSPPSQVCSHVPKHLDGWFLRSCDRDPSRRWPDPLAQVQAFEAALGPCTPVPIPLPMPVPLPFADRPPNVTWIGPSTRFPPPLLPRREIALLTVVTGCLLAGILLAHVWYGASVRRYIDALLNRAFDSPSAVSSSLPPSLPPSSLPSPPSSLPLSLPPSSLPSPLPPSSLPSPFPPSSLPSPFPPSSLLPSPPSSLPPSEASSSAPTTPPLPWPTTEAPSALPFSPSVQSAAPATETTAPGHRTPARVRPHPSAQPTDKKPPGGVKLEQGASCARSSQCQSGLCLAEICQ